jgi:LmbE family N-acetylglucosaminyl deacetylase
MKGLIIAAHPDDDAIFATPIQLSMKNVSWKVISVTYSSDHPRAQEMLRWHDFTKAHSVDFLGYKDAEEHFMQSAHNLPENELRERLIPEN